MRFIEFLGESQFTDYKPDPQELDDAIRVYTRQVKRCMRDGDKVMAAKFQQRLEMAQKQRAAITESAGELDQEIADKKEALRMAKSNGDQQRVAKFSVQITALEKKKARQK